MYTRVYGLIVKHSIL